MSARSSLERLRELGPAQDEQLRGQNLESASDRFLESVAKAKPRARWVVPTSVIAFAAAAALLFFLLPSNHALSFAVGSLHGQVGDWIAAPAEAPLEVRFTDGTALVLDAKARARVVAAEAHGAHVLLESGRLVANVTHTGKSAWRFNVGPFDVLVTGTRFELGWDPSKEELKLVLQEGSVIVSGPLVGERRPVVSGETLEVFCQERRFGLTRKDPLADVQPSHDPEASAPMPSTAAPPHGDDTPSASSVEVPLHRPAWRDLANESRYKEAMGAAEAEGFDSVASSANAQDLLMLADVARFSGKSARAAEALTATRTRFGGSGEAAKAAFHLGRLAFDQTRSYSDAERWFSTYLTEQPGGVFAQEALGRLIECRESLGSTSGAREAARRYLTTYPTGPHAEHAKSLLVGE